MFTKNAKGYWNPEVQATVINAAGYSNRCGIVEDNGKQFAIGAVHWNGKTFPTFNEVELIATDPINIYREVGSKPASKPVAATEVPY